MNYIFWSRRISDVDHMVPVIYGLLESGVSPVNMRYQQLWPDHTTEQIDRDRRITYLSSRGVTHQGFRLQIKLFNLSYLIRPNRKTAGSIHRLLSRNLVNTVFKIMEVHLNILCWSVARRFKGHAVFVTDLGTSYPYNTLSKWAKNFHIPIVGVPHGLAVHNGCKKCFPPQAYLSHTLDLYQFWSNDHRESVTT